MLSTESLVILPFQMQSEFFFFFAIKHFNTLTDYLYADMDEPPIICTTGTVNESEENIVIVTRANVQGNLKNKIA